MNHIRRRRIAAALTGLACASLDLALAAPTAFAQALSSPGYQPLAAATVREALFHGEDLAPASRSGAVPSFVTVIRTVVVGGMPGRSP